MRTTLSSPLGIHVKSSKKSIKKKFYRISDIPMIPRKEVTRPLKRLKREYEVLFN